MAGLRYKGANRSVDDREFVKIPLFCNSTNCLPSNLWLNANELKFYIQYKLINLNIFRKFYVANQNNWKVISEIQKCLYDNKLYLHTPQTNANKLKFCMKYKLINLDVLRKFHIASRHYKGDISEIHYNDN